MISAETFLCFPKLFQNKINIYPPRVKDIVGNSKFNQYLRILTITQAEIRDLFEEEKIEGNIPTPFLFMYGNYCRNEEVKKITEEAFEFFLHQKVTFVPKMGVILIGEIEKISDTIKNIEDLFYISEKNFFDFQNAIRDSLGIKKEEPELPPNPEEDPRVRALKEKFRKGKKKVSEVKAKTGKSLTLETCLVSICCMGIGLNPLNIGEISYASVSELMQMYQGKEKYDIDIRSLLAGADSKKVKPEYWIRNLND